MKPKCSQTKPTSEEQTIINYLRLRDLDKRSQVGSVNVLCCFCSLTERVLYFPFNRHDRSVRI